jgi:hypothetical protein
MDDYFEENVNSSIGGLVGVMTVITLDMKYQNLTQPNEASVIALKIKLIKKILDIRDRVSTESYLGTQL